jgi:hypothetical protein
VGKIRVYVESVEISTLSFVDKEGALHACAQAGDTAFSGLKHYPGSKQGRVLSEEEREALRKVEDFCEKTGHEFEVVDIGTYDFFSKMKLRMKRLTNIPAISYKDRVIHGVPTEEKLQDLVQK